MKKCLSDDARFFHKSDPLRVTEITVCPWISSYKQSEMAAPILRLPDR